MQKADLCSVSKLSIFNCQVYINSAANLKYAKVFCRHPVLPCHFFLPQISLYKSGTILFTFRASAVKIMVVTLPHLCDGQKLRLCFKNKRFSSNNQVSTVGILN